MEIKWDEIIDNNFALATVPNVLALLFTAYSIWILFFRPYNLVKDYTSYGYDHLQTKGVKRKQIVNFLLQRRKVGNLPPPFPNSWYAVLESDQLETKQVKEVYSFGQNLVAWRGENGSVFVADAYCPHLGAHLGAGGKVKGNCIECPFHKWSFDGQRGGRVYKVPYSFSNAQSLEKLPGLKMWRVIEANGFIWIWCHAQGQHPTWFPEDIPHISGGHWKYRGRSEFLVTCHIQEIPENGADMAHFQALHEAPAVFPQGFTKLTHFLEQIIQHKWSASWKANECPSRKHETLIEIAHNCSLFGGKINFFNISCKIQQIGMGIVIMRLSTPFGEGVMVQSVTPIEPLLQRITHRFYTERRFIHPLALVTLHGEAVQISRDVEIWNRKCFIKTPSLVKEDATIKKFRKWVSQFYSASEDGACAKAYMKNESEFLEF